MSETGQSRDCVLYIRPSAASTFDAAEQERRVRLAADAFGLTCGAVLREKARSARQRRAGLPIRAALLRRIVENSATVLVTDLALLGRSLPDLISVLAAVEANGSMVLVVDERGTARSVCAADLEAARRAYIRESVMDGRARARDRGVEFGRPRVVPEKVLAVKDALARGLGVRAAARAGGVGVATASRIRDMGIPVTQSVT